LAGVLYKESVEISSLGAARQEGKDRENRRLVKKAIRLGYEDVDLLVIGGRLRCEGSEMRTCGVRIALQSENFERLEDLLWKERGRGEFGKGRDMEDFGKDEIIQDKEIGRNKNACKSVH